MHVTATSVAAAGQMAPQAAAIWPQMLEPTLTSSKSNDFADYQPSSLLLWNFARCLSHCMPYDIYIKYVICFIPRQSSSSRKKKNWTIHQRLYIGSGPVDVKARRLYYQNAISRLIDRISSSFLGKVDRRYLAWCRFQ